MNHHRLSPFRLAVSLLALTATLAGCGGGTEKAAAPAPAPAPTAPIGLNFVQPANNVLEPSASEPLSVNLSVNGSPAPNGTVATFAVNPSALFSTTTRAELYILPTWKRISVNEVGGTVLL